MNSYLRISKKFPYRLAAFFLGLLVCGEIFTVYQANNSYIEVPHIYSLFLCFLFVIKSPRRAFDIFNTYCIKSLKIFSLLVALLVIPGMWVFRDTSWYISPIKGLIMYCILLSTLFDALFLREYKKNIISGVLWGFSLNLFYSMIQYLLYASGKNYVLLQGLSLRTIQNINGIFRAEGFFSEPSHYWLFLVCFFPLFLSKIKREYLATLFMAFVLFLFSITISGGIYAIVICCVLYIAFVKTCKEKIPLHLKSVKLSDVIISLSFLFMFCACLWILAPKLESMHIGKYINESLSDISVSNKSNKSTQQRFASILAALSLIPSYWYGVGYGMASPLILTAYENGVNTGTQYYVASFSYPITCCLETGILGLAAYLSCIYTLGIKLLRDKKEIQSRALSVGCMMCFIGQALTGRILYPYMMLLFGLGSLEYTDNASDTNRICL